LKGLEKMVGNGVNSFFPQPGVGKNELTPFPTIFPGLISGENTGPSPSEKAKVPEVARSTMFLALLLLSA
jgi:hypothetical protein